MKSISNSSLKEKELYLVTTSIQETWPKNSKIIFLGDWCKVFSQRKDWSNLNYSTPIYHWDDRKKLHKDYLYLNEVHEELLKLLTSHLNEVHQINKSVRYWRILIGPWALSFAQVLFDRWSMIRQVDSEYKVDKLIVFKNNPHDFVPENMNDFGELSNLDEWNEFIYGELVKFFFKNIAIIERNNKNKKNKNFRISKSKNLKKMNTKKNILGFFANLNKRIYSDNEYFFIDSLLSRKFELSLQLRLFQFPKIWSSNENSIPKNRIDSSKRNFQLNFKNKDDDFINVLRYMIPKFIPKSYLESFDLYSDSLKNNFWPKKPKAIITGSVFKSDLNRLWIAEKTEIGVPLIIRQHGGAYGVCEFSTIEDHEQTIADYWLSWGWSSALRDNVIPAGHFKYDSTKIKHNPEGNALMVGFSMIRNSYSLVSYPIASQWNYYFNDQANFVSSLPPYLRDELLIRLRSYDYGQCQEERWKELFPNLSIDKGLVPMIELIKDCRIYIATYNATSFLEPLNWNIPTIIFWDPKYNELNEIAKSDFELLKDVGIFHETPESAAKQMTEIWDNIPYWWNNNKLQSTRRNFCEKYVKSYSMPLNAASKIIKKTIKR